MEVIALTPGTMGLCALAIDVFGIDNVVPSGWGTPVYVKAGVPDLDAGIELIKERGLQRGMPIASRSTRI